ncbi:transcriptional regulator [Salmonella enterica subsp. enterica serovar Senftenberg]|nr:transcriptional regulator [Salmonella enterica subsp. enterica serovar Senftenberg]
MNRNQRRMAAYNAMKAAQKLEMQSYCKKIDRAFTRITEGCSNRVVAATSLVSLREKKTQEELPERSNRIYYSKPSREMGVTCVGRQKMKLGSKPLYEG